MFAAELFRMLFIKKARFQDPVYFYAMDRTVWAGDEYSGVF